MGYLVFFVAMNLLIFFHELGHFAAARLLKLKVDIFQVGIPAVLGFNLGETKFRLGLLPTMGFVRIRERHPKTWGKVFVSLAGPVASIIFGAALLLSSGIPIAKVAEICVKIPNALYSDLVTNPNSLVVTPEQNNALAIGEIANELDTTLIDILQLIGVISIAVASFNLLPIPPLDGGHIFFDILEGFFGKRRIKIYDLEIPLVNLVRGLIMVGFAAFMIYTLIAEIVFAVQRLLN